ncbi:MAG TPA: hypothetical protein VK997_06210, partial [Deferrisomatales bacterium]|nr:hypothetical protein [Deferrisomatales bacterium]
TAANPLAPLAPLAALDPGGVLWTAVTGTGPSSAGAVASGAPAAPSPTLPPPPVAPSSFLPASPLSWGGLLGHAGGWYRQVVRSLGAPFLLQPLLVAAFGTLGLAWAIESTHPIPAGVLFLGLAAFFHSFVLLLRKRAIQNCPTARVRSLPMGEVEVTGRAAQKYFLKAPYTRTDCVYYSYEVYARATGRDQTGYTLRESGHSGAVPFYLEEGSHRVLVQPEKAIIHAGTAQTLYGSLGCLGLPLGRSVPADGKVVERVIATGDPLYVMGCARRVRYSAHDHRQRFRDKLRELKTDRKRMQRYDLDGDGRIDAEEWAQARGDVEEEALLAGLTEPADRDEVAIGEHPAGGLFYISDRKEEAILGSLAWKIPLAFAVGVVGIIGGGYTLVQTLVRTGWWQRLAGG